jgi:glycosyltransferase involved in cell wall biosynthesis
MLETMETPEKVSIILPTYNGAKYLRQSIDSCLTQTYKYLELIIVDDGSIDETSQIIRSYQDGRIKYVSHGENKRLPHALNTGFAMATGEYLTWTSDDNYYAEDAIESMLVLLQADKTIDFVYANYYTINDNGAVLQSVSVGPSKNLKEYNCIGPCFLYRRKIYDVIGEYNPNALFAEDYEYWIRVFKRFRMQKLEESIYFHRLHPQSLTGQYATEAKRRADRIRDHYFKIHAIGRVISNYRATSISWLAVSVRVTRRLLKTAIGHSRLF